MGKRGNWGSAASASGRSKAICNCQFLLMHINITLKTYKYLNLVNIPPYLPADEYNSYVCSFSAIYICKLIIDGSVLSLFLWLFRTQMVPTVSCQERISNQNFSILSGPALAVLQPTALMWMTSSRLELQKLTVTRLHLLTTPFRSTAMKAEDHWPGHWVPSSLSQQSPTWIMTICRVGGQGLRSWQICTGPKTAPLMMLMMVKTLNSGLTEWTPPRFLISWFHEDLLTEG